MRKVVLVVAIVAIATYTADAQVRVGLKAGLNGYDFGGDDSFEEYGTKFGLHGGVLVNIPVSEKFSVQPEVLYSDEGARYSDAGYVAKFNFTYINIPVLARLSFASGFYVEAGPQVGFLASAKQKVKYEGETANNDIKDEFKSINFSVAAGAGYRHASGFGAGARYNLGLANIYDAVNADWTLSGFQAGISYLLSAGGGKAKKEVIDKY